MPTATKSVISGYPKWLHRILSGRSNGRYQEATAVAPEENETRAALLALNGMEMREIMLQTSMPWFEVQAAVKKVRDAMRRGEVPKAISEAHGDLCDQQCAAYRVDATRQRQKKPGGAVDVQEKETRVKFPARIEKMVRAISDAEYVLPDTEDPEKLAQFHDAILARAKIPLAVIATRQMAEGAMRGDSTMVNRALDFVFGKTKSANRQGTGNSNGGPVPQTDARNFNMEYEKIQEEIENQDKSGFGKGGDEDILEIEDFPENEEDDGGGE